MPNAVLPRSPPAHCPFATERTGGYVKPRARRSVSPRSNFEGIRGCTPKRSIPRVFGAVRGGRKRSAVYNFGPKRAGAYLVLAPTLSRESAAPALTPPLIHASSSAPTEGLRFLPFPLSSSVPLAAGPGLLGRTKRGTSGDGKRLSAVSSAVARTAGGREMDGARDGKGRGGGSGGGGDG